MSGAMPAPARSSCGSWASGSGSTLALALPQRPNRTARGLPLRAAPQNSSGADASASAGQGNAIASTRPVNASSASAAAKPASGQQAADAKGWGWGPFGSKKAEASTEYVEEYETESEGVNASPATPLPATPTAASHAGNEVEQSQVEAIAHSTHQEQATGDAASVPASAPAAASGSSGHPTEAVSYRGQKLQARDAQVRAGMWARRLGSRHLQSVTAPAAATPPCMAVPCLFAL